MLRLGPQYRRSDNLNLRLGRWSRWFLAFVSLAISSIALFTIPVSMAHSDDLGFFGTAFADDEDKEATLYYLNRPIVTFRATIGTFSPSERVKRAHQRIEQIPATSLEAPIEINRVEFAGASGRLLTIGGQLLFALAPGDLDPEQILDIDAMAQDAKAKMEEAFVAELEQARLPIILHGIGFTLIATVTLAALSWLIWRAKSHASQHLHKLISAPVKRASARRIDWTRYGYALSARLTELLSTFAILFLAYVWFSFTLEQFPATAPVGARLNTFLVGLGLDLGAKMAGAVPGIVTAIVILLIAQAIVQVITNLFSAAERGTVVLPFVRPETASATRRILRVVIWAIALAIAYPYIPGSDSAAFQGLSVLIGVMFTLGSTGIVAQMMSGTVLVYSRALQLGEYIHTGNSEGIVTEMGAISTKLRTVFNEEVTIPNSVLVGATIVNYSRRTQGVAILLKTKITIGYDAPWRQVHAMLLLATEGTDGLLEQPKPYVLQRALSDFYVEYELFVYTNRPLERLKILSALHSKIQDIFNENGVQIMSPHFVGQPADAPLVPKEKWYASPAAKD